MEQLWIWGTSLKIRAYNWNSWENSKIESISNQHAKEMLQKFSGKTQNVYSGVCIFKGPSKKVLFHEDTQVTFDTLSDEVIDAYIATKVPLDHKQD